MGELRDYLIKLLGGYTERDFIQSLFEFKGSLHEGYDRDIHIGDEVYFLHDCVPFPARAIVKRVKTVVCSDKLTTYYVLDISRLEYTKECIIDVESRYVNKDKEILMIANDTSHEKSIHTDRHDEIGCVFNIE